MSRNRETESGPREAFDATLAASPGDVDATLPAGSLTNTPTHHDRPEGSRLVSGDKVGRYQIEKLIGRGGMGEVYAAYDPQLDRLVALKVLLAHVQGEAHAVRLVREAQSLARLHHPNVVAVYDAGEDGDHVFLAMQLVEGDTLAATLRARTRSCAEIVGLFVEAGRGLAAAHAAGVVHRDFKPSNVLVDRAGHVAVTDFGLARHAAIPEATVPSETSERRPSGPSVDLTMQGEMLGTPAYMAAEQIAGIATSPATDQFAFCVALWEALLGAHPFADPESDHSPLSYASANLEGELRVPARHSVPRRIIAALTRGLARQPSKRWPSMDVLLRELDAATTRRRWPLIAAAAGVAATSGVVLVLAGGEPAASCTEISTSRLSAVWGPSQAAAIETRLATSGRGEQATRTAALLRRDLDDYGARWTAASSEACTAPGDDTGVQNRVVTRIACLDRAHAAIGATVVALTSAPPSETIERATLAVRMLPDLTLCATESIGAPPPAIAARLAELEVLYAQAAALTSVGAYPRASEQVAALRRDAAVLAWEPFQVRVDMKSLEIDHALQRATYEAARAVGARAGKVGLHATETDAQIVAMIVAPDRARLDAALGAAVAAAAAVGGAEARLEVSLGHGRALVRQRRYAEAADQCREGLTQTRSGSALEEEAQDCLIEALTPLNKSAELAPLIDRAMTTKVALYGSEHPAVADLLVLRATVHADSGKHADAELAIRRALAIQRRAFGDRSLRVADTLRTLAMVVFELEEGSAKTRQLLDEALAIAMEQQPRSDSVLFKIHRDYGAVAMDGGDLDGVRHHYKLSLTSVERDSGRDSLATAFILVMYGQYQTAWDFDGGIAKLHRAIAIFDGHKDPRAAGARTALGRMLLRKGRATAALTVYEAAIAKTDETVMSPVELAGITWDLAKALIATRGDRKRASTFAHRSAEYYAAAGQRQLREHVLDWIKANRL